VRERTSFRKVLVQVDDSPRLRTLTRIHSTTMMDFTTLCALLNAIRPETWKCVNDLRAEASAAEGWIEGKSLQSCVSRHSACPV